MVLKALFAIPQCQIDSEIAEADKLPGDALRERLNRFCDKPATHVWTAQEHHEFMVAAKACQSRPKVPYEFRVYVAALGAERIAQQVTAAPDHHAGLDCPEHETDRRKRLMAATVLSVFRRYRLDDLADIYESNSEELDRLVARGHEIGSENPAELTAGNAPQAVHHGG